MARPFTLRELEDATGKPRTTIFYYTSRGLLPHPQKTPTGRVLYSEDHVMILEEIDRLKGAGRSLEQIKMELGHVLERVDQTEVDLAAHQRERVHSRILSVAYDQFASRGYAKTHVSGIIKEVGITVTVFYDHFPSKRVLLAECVAALAEWSHEFVESQRGQIHDPVEELMWYFFAHLPVFQLGAAARALLIVEEPAREGGLQRMVDSAHASVVQSIEKVLRACGPRKQGSCGVADELIAENIYGAADLLFRSPSRRYSRKDLIRSHMWLVLTACSGGSGCIDVESELGRLEPLVDYFATHMPPRPPVLQFGSSSAETNA